MTIKQIEKIIEISEIIKKYLKNIDDGKECLKKIKQLYNKQLSDLNISEREIVLHYKLWDKYPNTFKLPDRPCRNDLKIYDFLVLDVNNQPSKLLTRDEYKQYMKNTKDYLKKE